MGSATTTSSNSSSKVDELTIFQNHVARRLVQWAGNAVEIACGGISVLHRAPGRVAHLRDATLREQAAVAAAEANMIILSIHVDKDLPSAVKTP